MKQYSQQALLLGSASHHPKQVTPSAPLLVRAASGCAIWHGRMIEA
jgi:hypothetical protein